MTSKDLDAKAALKDESTLHWGFLEEEREACAVVSPRMELIYINSAGQRLTPGDWFGKRCFEVLPTVEERCAWQCPTIQAVAKSPEIVYSEELICDKTGAHVRLGVAVIPLESEAKGREGKELAKAVLFFRRKDAGVDGIEFQCDLLEDAQGLRERILEHLV